jgi:transposase
MTLFVGLDVSLKMTSICIVEADGSPIWEGKVESEPVSLVKALSAQFLQVD